MYTNIRPTCQINKVLCFNLSLRKFNIKFYLISLRYFSIFKFLSNGNVKNTSERKINGIIINAISSK